MVQASRRKYHYIYKITRDDGKYYIGMHSTDDLVNDTYFGSGKRLRYSINKHGIEKHSKEIIEHCFTREALREREKEIVNEELLNDSLCMNLRIGGEGGFSKWHIENAYEFHARGGRAASVIRREILKIKRQDKNWSEKYSKTMSLACKGRKSFLGKSHTEETKQKMRKSKNKGESNGQFGTCWITKDLKSLKIKKTEIKEYLEKGYSLGRKMPI